MTKKRAKPAETEAATGAKAKDGKKVLGLLGEAVMVPIGEILADPDHRTDHSPDECKALAASIADVGLLQPVILFKTDGTGPEKYRCADGRRRLTAVRQLGRTAIAAWVFPAADAAVRRRVAALANLERRDLNPLEEALAVCRLLESLDPGHLSDVWTDVSPALIDQAAAELGRSSAWVRDRAYLSRLSEGVLSMVADRRLPLAHAREIAKLASANEQLDVARGAIHDWFGRSEHSGQVQVDALSTVRRAVAGRLSTLRGVPWEPGVAFAGRPACARCPDSSAHAVLFGIDADDAAPEARCLNLACYEAKMSAAEKALAVTVKKLKVDPSVAPTAGSVRRAAPDYLKAATVARHLAKARGPEPKKPAKDAEGGPKDVPYEDRPEVKYRAAHSAWEDAVFSAVCKALLADPKRAACAALAPMTETYARNVACGRDADKRVHAKVEPILKRIVSATDGDIAALVGDIRPENLFPCNGVDVPTWVARRLAVLLDVALPPEPRLEEFQPKATPEAGKKKTKKG